MNPEILASTYAIFEDMTDAVLSLLEDNRTVKKAELHPALKAMDEALALLAPVLPPNDTRMDIPLFAYPTSQLLKMVEKRLEIVKSTPEVAIAQAVQQMKRYMESFLDKYHIGWLREFYLDDSGFINVTICCNNISKSSVDGYLPSAQKQFRTQIETLNGLGLSLYPPEYSNGAYAMVFSDANVATLGFLLKKHGAQLLQFSSRDDVIYEVSFFVRCEDAKQFDIKSDSKASEATSADIINDDERETLLRAQSKMSEVLNTMASLDVDSMDAVCGNLALYHFTEICDAVSYEGTVAKNVRAKHQVEKDMNQRIRQMEKDLGSALPFASVPAAMKKLKSRLLGFTMNNLGFSASDIKVDGHGIIKTTLKYVEANSSYGRGDLLGEDALKDMFETTGVSRHWRDLFIKDTSENKKRLMDAVIAEIPSASFSGAHSGAHTNGEFILKEMDMAIADASCIFALPEPTGDIW